MRLFPKNSVAKVRLPPGTLGHIGEKKWSARYLNSLSNRMNGVMKVLTTIATIFIPATFVAGICRTNFEPMPELKWPWGYPAVWLVMVAVASGLLFLFKRRGWMGK